MSSLYRMIQAGWALTPIPFGEKAPKTRAWNQRDNCVTEISQIHRLKNMNIGLCHAFCRPTPTCSIDIDKYTDAKAWLKRRDIDIKSLLLASDAVVIWSGKRNSIKLLYRLPDKVPPLLSKIVKNDYGNVALEFRCATHNGKTVQDVIPPSKHPSGVTYRWFGSTPFSPPEIPPVLLDTWTELLQTPSVLQRVSNNSRAGSMLETPRQVAIVEDALKFINANCSYIEWRDVVWGILSTRWTVSEELARTWSMSAPNAFDEEKFINLVKSYRPDTERKITIGTVFYHAKSNGWSKT